MLASRLITKFNLSLSITSIDSSLLWVNQVSQDPGDILEFGTMLIQHFNVLLIHSSR